MMSIIQPFRKDLLDRFKYRFPGNAIGCVLFFGLCAVLPESFYGCIGMLGGVGVGFSATYLWQTVFNSFGACHGYGNVRHDRVHGAEAGK